jgi:hypothetical protein
LVPEDRPGLQDLLRHVGAPQGIPFVKKVVHWLIRDTQTIFGLKVATDEELNTLGLIERVAERGVYDLVCPVVRL